MSGRSASHATPGAGARALVAPPALMLMIGPCLQSELLFRGVVLFRMDHGQTGSVGRRTACPWNAKWDMSQMSVTWKRLGASLLVHVMLRLVHRGQEAIEGIDREQAVVDLVDLYRGAQYLKEAEVADFAAAVQNVGAFPLGGRHA